MISKPYMGLTLSFRLCLCPMFGYAESLSFQEGFPTPESFGITGMTTLLSVNIAPVICETVH